MARITIPGFDLDQKIAITRHADGGYSAFGRRAHMKVGGSRAECVRCMCLVGRGCVETAGWIISVPGQRGVRTVCWTCAEISDSAQPSPAVAQPKASKLQPREAETVAALRDVFFQAMQQAKHSDQAVAYAMNGALLRRAATAEEDGNGVEAARLLGDYLARVEGRLAELQGRLERAAFSDRRPAWEAGELAQIALDVRTLIDRLSA